jgi:hypothetical protein
LRVLAAEEAAQRVAEVEAQLARRSKAVLKARLFPEVENAPRIKPVSEEVEAWGEWAQRLGDRLGGWDWFVTLTWRDLSPAGYWTKPGLSFCKRGWREFVKEIGRRRGLHDVEYIAGWEYQPDRGVPHVHALVTGSQGVHRLGMMDYWYGRYGIARVLPYDSAKGARYYISKYVVKPGMLALDLSAGLRPVEEDAK